jgi:hypothetical protein
MMNMAEKKPASKKKVPVKIMKPAAQKRKISPWLYWAPRIMTIIFILYISMFSLDVFDMDLGFWGTIVGLFMHNIPSFVMIVLLIVAWKHEWVGAIGYIALALLYIISAASRVNLLMALSWSLTIAGPAILLGALWDLNWRWKKKNKS